MSAAKLCAYCGEAPIPKGATRYCADCKLKGKTASAKAVKRKPCRRCGGPEGDDAKGARYCAPCREVQAPANEQYEMDRKRQVELAAQHAALMDGRTSRPVRVKAPDGHKACTRCERVLPLTSFGKRSTRQDQPYSMCIPCTRSYGHARNLRANYGMTPDDYAALYEAQGGTCAICLRRPRSNRLAVDHNHTTGEIRGLLCYRCNKQVLGNAMESSSLLRRAANYLDAPPARTGAPLDTLDHYDELAESVFSEDAAQVQDGSVVVNASGDQVALTINTMSALAQLAGCALAIGDEVLMPSEQLTTEDYALAEQAWKSYSRQMAAGR